MSLKKIAAGVLLLLSFISADHGMCFASNVAPPDSLNHLDKVDVLTSYQLFCTAYDNYVEAKQSVDIGDVSKCYAAAISAISQAAAIEPDNVSYLVLASQIYRGKGGISYAKEYFSRAEAILERRLKEDPNDIEANLNYAILCHAGDARYWKERDIYEKKAMEHANTIIALCHNMPKEPVEASYRRYLALAYLVKGDSGICEKILEEEDAPLSKTDVFYRQMYRDSVVVNQWIWPTKSVDKEFLLYCLIFGK